VLNVSVMSDDHGSALPADGGAPGAAYLGYHAALVKRDRATLKALLSLDRQQAWTEAEKKGNAAKFVDYLAAEHPDKSVRIVRGFVKGNTAVLLLSGEALLMKEKGAWHVDDELMDLAVR
jgi:inosine/xanthosine triphosphate pyrophosphatase family protein